jgi:hypothetical protein
MAYNTIYIRRPVVCFVNSSLSWLHTSEPSGVCLKIYVLLDDRNVMALHVLTNPSVSNILCYVRAHKVTQVLQNGFCVGIGQSAFINEE